MKPARTLLMLAGLAAAGSCVQAATVVLIGGDATEAPGRHEYAQGLRRLATLLQRQAPALTVRQLPRWPDDAAALRDADALVLYCDGDARHPLLEPARRAQFEALMQRGAGFVALHQAATLPAAQAPLLQRWLGGVRVGLFDRSTETATLQPERHALNAGVPAFTYRDEFYPTLRLAPQRVAVVLTAQLQAQFRAGRALTEDAPQLAPVAWAFEREGGGRSFAYTGAHFLAAFDEPALQRLLLNAVLWSAHQPLPPGALPQAIEPAGASAGDVTTFHHDAQRSGAYDDEKALTPAAVSAADFGLLWQSAVLHADGVAPPRLYATPLFVQRLRVGAGPQRGQTFAAVIAATSNGDVYAINAAPAGDLAPGRILWRTRLAPPCRLQPAPLDGVATGVLATPVIDARRNRLYVTHCDAQQRWQAYALDLGSGAVLPGWPVALDEAALNAVNTNAGAAPVPPRRRFDFRVQRGALNLSADGARLFVVFGETETGWLVALDTQQARIAAAFASAATPHRGSGGIWGAGGPALDEAGNVYVATGSGFDGYVDQPRDWTQSLLKLTPELRLVGSYTPFNHCSSARNDIDLGSGGPALAPGGLPLLALGGKQGNVYLLNRTQLPGRLDRRPPCSDDAGTDASLLAPEPQPQYGGRRGPLNVFGPYSEEDGALDLARARSVPAWHRDAQGGWNLLMTGSTRAAPGSSESVPPSLVRLQLVQPAHGAPYLRVAARQRDTALLNPGSPVLSSRAGHDAIVWVLDENARRSALLVGPQAPAPVLYAFDAGTLALLWRSAPGELGPGAKYNEPLIAQGQVIVGTDRIQAFGAGAPPRAAAAPAADAATLWRQRCAACHDAPQGNVPARERLARLAPARITQALTQGAMQPMAAGLQPADLHALAQWLVNP